MSDIKNYEVKSLAREVKFAQMQIKTLSKEGYFEGYASLFGKIDLGKDIILPGAFQQSLRRKGAKGIKMLFQHDPNEPIGIWLDIKEDRLGLYVKGRLMQDVARAREVHSLMQAGALDGLSIGFRTLEGHRDSKTGIRRLKKIDLWEISIVTFPMQTEARVQSVKNKYPGHLAEKQLLKTIQRASKTLRLKTRKSRRNPSILQHN